MDKAELGRQTLLELLGDWATKPVEEVLERLTYCEVGVKPAVPLATVLARPDEFKERLLAEVAKSPAELTTAMEATPDDRHAYFLHLFGIFLLALWEEPRAYRPLLAFLAADTEAALELLDDTVTEDLHTILARTWDGGDLGTLKALIEDSSANPFVRSACLRSLMTLERMGRLPQGEMIAYAADILERLRHEDNRDFAALLVMSLAELQEAGLRPAIDRWYADGLVDPMMPPSNIDAAYEAEFGDINEELVQRDKFDGLIDYLCEWPWFNVAEPEELDQILDDGGYDVEAPFVREGRKIGRNEPCPCGSGKKYKKCCLEKEAY